MSRAATRREALAGISQALQDALEAQRSDDGTLSEVEQVQFGRRFRGRLRAPFIWVVPGSITVDHQATGLTETTTWVVNVIGAVSSSDPVEGELGSYDLAARAVAACIGYEGDLNHGRKLGLGYVADLTLRGFMPVTGTLDVNNQLLYGYSGQVAVRFVALEN